MNSISACEPCIRGTVGCDTEHEQETPECDRLSPDSRVALAAVWAFDAIMGHIPPCMQHLQEQADWHEAGCPFISSGTWKEPHNPRATSSVQEKRLITFFLV